MNPGATIIAGFIASMGGLIGAYMMKPKRITEHEFGIPVHRT